MTAPRDRDPRSGRGRLPKNRARVTILATLAVLIVVAFGYMLLVGALA